MSTEQGQHPYFGRNGIATGGNRYIYPSLSGDDEHINEHERRACIYNQFKPAPEFYSFERYHAIVHLQVTCSQSYQIFCFASLTVVCSLMNCSV